MRPGERHHQPLLTSDGAPAGANHVAWAIVVLDKLEVGVRLTAADVNEGGGS